MGARRRRSWAAKLALTAGILVVVAGATLVAAATAPDRILKWAGEDAATTRLVTGILVTGTPARPMLYATSSDPRIGGDESGKNVGTDTNSGVVSRLTWTGSRWERLDLVRGLPRSRHNHATNGLALDSADGVLYVAQGGNTNMGAPSHYFARLPEYALSAAILSIDLRRIGNRTYDLPTLDDRSRPGQDDVNDPFGGNGGRNQALLVRGGPVRVHAPGYRNAYDVLISSRGQIYTSQNGAAKEWGGRPAREGPAGVCTNDRAEPGSYDRDTLHLVSRRGEYGGHPNPTRGNRDNTFDGQSPVAAASPVECDYRPVATGRGEIASFPTSTNGLAEYTASNLAGSMTGDLLAASFDRNVYRLKLNRAGDRVVRQEELFRLDAPLDVVAQGDHGIFPGTIWVARYSPGFTPENPARDENVVVFEPVDAGRGRSWRVLAPSGLERQEVSFVEAGGKLYLAGGDRRHQVYEPLVNRWGDAAPLPADLDHIQGVEVGGRVYYIGGLAGFPGPEVGSVYVYDPATDRFSTAAAMKRPRGAGGVAVHGGKIYYAGGLHRGAAVAWFDVYDPQADSWSRLPDMPRARDHFQAAVVGGRLYAIGGRNRDIDATTTANDAFDFRQGAWVTGLAALPTARGGFAAAAVGDEIVVIGGEREDGAVAAVEAYDTATDSWRTLDPMPTPRHGIQAAVCGGAIYVAAGGATPGGGDPTDVTEALFLREQSGCGRAPAAGARPRRGSGPLRASFRRSVLDGTSSTNPTSLQFGPDGRLYVAQQDGRIKAYTIVRRGPARYAVTETEEIDEIQAIRNYDDDGSSATDFAALVDAVLGKLGL